MMDNPTTLVEPAITPHMTLLEIMYRWRATEKIFQAYESQAGVCLRCQALFCTLAEASHQYGLNLQALLEDLQSCIQTLPRETGEPV